MEANNLLEKDLSPIASKIDIDEFTSAHEMLMKKLKLIRNYATLHYWIKQASQLQFLKKH